MTTDKAKSLYSLKADDFRVRILTQQDILVRLQLQMSPAHFCPGRCQVRHLGFNVSQVEERMVRFQFLLSATLKYYFFYVLPFSISQIL